MTTVPLSQHGSTTNNSASTLEEIKERLSRTERSLDALRGDIAQNDKEIDDLQIQKSWFRNGSTLIALLALLLSVLTTGFSLYRQFQQDVQAEKTELRALLQRLSAIPKELIEAQAKYNSQVAYQISVALNGENQLLARQAADLMRSIPRYVSGPDYTTVAHALMQTGNYTEARELLEQGISRSKHGWDKVTVFRQYAGLLFSTGDLDGGREKLRSAIDEAENGSDSVELVNWIKTETYSFWATLEAGNRQCAQAREAFGRANEHIQKVRMMSASLQPVLAATQSSVDACSES